MKSFPAFRILLGSRGKISQLLDFLRANSNLPGPRGNLELAQSFARAVGDMHLEEWQWQVLLDMASTSLAEEPANSVQEYIPFCGLLAIGAQYGNGLPRPRRRTALAALWSAASHTRWRVREGVAMGLQLAGEQDPAALRATVTDWLPRAGYLEMRAVAASLAHPPLLGDPDFALFCLETSRTILAEVARADPGVRRDESFRVLCKGMGYALSVFVAHAPADGFALLRKSAAVQDRDVAWIVRENLTKKRLTGPFPGEVKKVEAIAAEAGAAGPSSPARQ
jgi:hypothetical protein